METEIVGVVGHLKTMEVPPLRELDVNVGVALCLNGRRSPLHAIVDHDCLPPEPKIFADPKQVVKSLERNNVREGE